MRITRYAAAAAAGILLAGCSSQAGSQAQQSADTTAAVDTNVKFDAGTTMARLHDAGGPASPRTTRPRRRDPAGRSSPGP